MESVSSFVRRHSVGVYVLLTFTISWGGTLLAIGSAGGMRGSTPTSDPRFAYAVLAMLAGPSVTGVALTALISGSTGLRGLLRRLVTWRVAARWYLVALLTAPAVMTATLAALSFTSSDFLPGVLTSDGRASILLVGLAVGLSAGIFEEIGWTGFATPTMRQRHGVNATGVIVGMWWSAWHLLPNLWSSGVAAAQLSLSAYLVATAIGIFVGYLTAFRLLMVWVYEHTGSLLIAMLMHVSLTVSLLTLNPLAIAGTNLQIYSFALATVVWLIAVMAVRSPARHPADGAVGGSSLTRAPIPARPTHRVDAT